MNFWWEVGRELIAFDCQDSERACATGKRWFPYMKGGGYRKWYGNQEFIINYHEDGYELKAWADPLYGNSGWSRIIKSVNYYYRQGLTWTDLGASGFSARISPGGFIFDVSGSCAFPEVENEVFGLLALMNASFTGYLLGLLNPTMHFQVGDLKRLPVPDFSALDSQPVIGVCLQMGKSLSMQDESTYDFITPPQWESGLDDLVAAQTRLAVLEGRINEAVYHLYGISEEDRVAIEAELTGDKLAEDGSEDESPPADEEEQEEPAEAPMTREELALHWISYAIGIALGRFQPGAPGGLGCAVYRRADFAVGSLPAPDEAEFDELVGLPERFAYVDADGGRHLFSAEIEAALRDLAVPDGVTVLDEGHPRNLPALVEQALSLMLGDEGAQEIIAEGTGGDPSTSLRASLRKFLEKDFFTKWHFRWYRKRPVYWLLQSAKRSYGFVLFHERVDRMTLYTLQRDYLDHKLNGLRLGIGDLQGQAANQSGAARKRVERQIDGATQLLDEVTEFAATMERIVRQGYQPEENWIDDGVILRLAPLWELIPIWWREPKKYWERLEQGDYDWSHIAKRYWPERVREKCKTNKSFAIAHGLEALFQEQ